MELRGWNVIDAERSVLWREYEFSKGAFATTLVFRSGDGLVVVSPGSRLDPGDYDVLKDFGEVRALIANNGFHHLGHIPWREHFPKAESYAAPQALARLRKKRPEVLFRTLGDLSLPPTVRAHPMSGFKNGELFFTIGTQKGCVWYTGDPLTNIQRTPGPPISWLFSLTDSAPGFRLFRPSVWFFVKDRRALRQHVERLLAEEPPAIIVPAHGPAVQNGDVATLLRREVDKL